MSFPQRLWDATTTAWGLPVTFIGVFGTLVVFFVAPDKTTVPLNWVLLVGCTSFFVMCILLRAAYEAHRDSASEVPRVITVIDPPAAYKNAAALLLLDPTKVLAYDSVVSLYFLQDGIERFCGVGVVANIQRDGKVQVVMAKDEDYSDLVQGFKGNKPDDLSRLLVKASVPRTYLGGAI